MFLWCRLFHREFITRKTVNVAAGFSLLEAMISLCIFAIGVLALCRLQYLAYELSLTALRHSIMVNHTINDQRTFPS
ncbi:MAG: type IV pilus modification PilV family protein [Gammaproteobacteria bacterium]